MIVNDVIRLKLWLFFHFFKYAAGVRQRNQLYFSFFVKFHCSFFWSFHQRFKTFFCKKLNFAFEKLMGLTETEILSPKRLWFLFLMVFCNFSRLKYLFKNHKDWFNLSGRKILSFSSLYYSPSFQISPPTYFIIYTGMKVTLMPIKRPLEPVFKHGRSEFTTRHLLQILTILHFLHINLKFTSPCEQQCSQKLKNRK